jgi:hypothetical protein
MRAARDSRPIGVHVSTPFLGPSTFLHRRIALPDAAVNRNDTVAVCALCHKFAAAPRPGRLGQGACATASVDQPACANAGSAPAAATALLRLVSSAVQSTAPVAKIAAATQNAVV